MRAVPLFISFQAADFMFRDIDIAAHSFVILFLVYAAPVQGAHSGHSGVDAAPWQHPLHQRKPYHQEKDEAAHGPYAFIFYHRNQASLVCIS
jgi:hypothetical protein